MSKATDTLKFLAIFNSWRRGDETFVMQDPTEIGAAIDDAVNLLRKYDELEKENAALKASSELLTKELKQMYIREAELRDSLIKLSQEVIATGALNKK